MSCTIQRSYEEPKREGLTWTKRWKSEDRGLIACWEVGRRLRKRDPELAFRAEKGELPVLQWKGGVEKKIKKNQKYGTLNYLAQWQGLRGEDLKIGLSDEPELICSLTGVKVIYTANFNKYANA